MSEPKTNAKTDARSDAKADAGQRMKVALDRLQPDPENVRQVYDNAEIARLAANLEAEGLLQELLVRPGPGRTLHVMDGERRRRALLLLRDDNRTLAGVPVTDDLLVSVHIRRADRKKAKSLSLSAGLLTVPLHPVDCYIAFRDLAEAGLDPDRIAARYGVTRRLVDQRLRLAQVHPAILDAYRAGDVNHDQVIAFAASLDQGRQLAHFQATRSGWQMNPDQIRIAMRRDRVPATSSYARFVGLDAYTEAGGRIDRDLFDEADTGTLLDPGLLDTLVAAKLEQVRVRLAGEGWGWVQVSPGWTLHDVAQLPRAERAATAEEQARLDTIEAEMLALGDLDPATPAEEADLQARYAALDAEADAIREALKDGYIPAQMALAGAAAWIVADGTLRTARGLVRPEDVAALQALTAAADAPQPDHGGGSDDPGGDADGPVPPWEDDPAAADDPGPTAAAGAASPGDPADGAPQPVRYTDKLRAQLATRFTLALAAEILRRPADAYDLCIAALAAQLVPTVSIPGLATLRAGHVPYDALDGQLAENPDHIALQSAIAAWTPRLVAATADAAGLYGLVRRLDPQEKDALFALCIGISVNATHDKFDWQSRHRQEAGRHTAEALGLDMAERFVPDTAFLDQLTKGAILAILAEAGGEGAFKPDPGAKKAEIVAYAARTLRTSRWVPEEFRTTAWAAAIQHRGPPAAAGTAPVADPVPLAAADAGQSYAAAAE